MIQLPNGCYCGELVVTPKNWKQLGASLKKDWYISYRFYDPQQKDKYPKGKFRVVKGMNTYLSLDTRRTATKEIIKIELSLLQDDGFNPITGVLNQPVINKALEIEPTTPILKALQYSFDKITIEKGTRDDIASMLKFFSQAVNKLQYQNLEIAQLRRKHIKIALEEVKAIRPAFSNSRFNKYRTYLMILFSELMELDAVELNPVKDIRKKKEIKKIREVLTDKQRVEVNEYLFLNYKPFWQFLHIFYHSGAREVEMVRVQRKDVDLDNQRCKYLVKKGGDWHEVWRPIKDSVLPLWIAQVAGASPEDYVFSEGLLPGTTAIKSYQITKRWYRLVKKKLGITADFYSLKHLNTDETAALLDIKDAAAQNSHTSTVITMKHYAFGEKDRQNERLKKVGNKFA